MVYFRLLLVWLVAVCPVLEATPVDAPPGVQADPTCSQKIRRGGRRPRATLTGEAAEEAAAETAAMANALALYNRDLETFHERFTKDEERELFRQYYEEGNEQARMRIINSLLPWVINIAKKYRGRGMDLEDLIQEGNVGLVVAFGKFDLSRNTRFSTYATWWVRQQINQALKDGGHIRIPAYLQEIANKWRVARARLADRLGRTPSNEEVACAMDLDIKKPKIRNLIMAMNLYVSQGSMTNEQGDEGDVMAMQPAPEAFDPITILSSIEEFPLMLARMKTLLEPREREVLLLRFGIPLDDGIERDSMTLNEIGERYGLTRERVRQIESSSLRKLIEAVANR